jgi:hypothetical protein
MPVAVGARPGLAHLRIELGGPGESVWPEEGCSVASADGSVNLNWLIGERSIATPDDWGASLRQDAVLADGITHVGHTLSDLSPAPGNTVFRQVLSAEGQVVAQADSEPNRGLYPTTAWRPGEVVSDAQELVLPIDLPEGEYTILVGMYHWPDMERLAVTSGGDPGQDAIIVSILDVHSP